MKKAISLILVAVLIASIVTGCGTGVANSEYYVQDVHPNVVTTGDSTGTNGYYYLIDKNTGVVYLCYKNGYRAAITVMLHADGTPILAEQLDIKY